MSDLSVFEDTLIKWIKKTDRNAELILLVFGHYYQFGVGCDIDKSKALALYLSVIMYFQMLTNFVC